MGYSDRLGNWNYARIVLKLLTVAILVTAVWVWRPLFHGLIYRSVYSPGGVYIILIPALVGLLLFLLPPIGRSKDDSFMVKGTIVVVVLVLGLVAAVSIGFYGSLAEERAIADSTMGQADSMEEFPSVNEDNARIVPRAVADVQTRGSVSYRQHRLGHSDIARMENGTLAWSYPIQPDQFRNRLAGNQRGIFLSDMTSMSDREMQPHDDTAFENGEGMLLHRSAEWNLLKDDYWVQYKDDPIEFTYDGEPYMAYPKTGHEWNNVATIDIPFTPLSIPIPTGVPYTTPTWEGVGLVHANGTIDHLNPGEAIDEPILDGQRLYPLYNSKRYAESLGYRNGIINQLAVFGTFEDVVEPASLPSGAGNEQPFVVDLEGEQMSYVYAMEPSGDDTRGLDEVWFFDAETGQPTFFETEGETLLGPERAMGIVRSEDTRTDWQTESSDGEFQVVEPVPTVVDGELWWHAKVVPSDNTDVTRNAFVNAHSGTVLEAHDTDTVTEFIAGDADKDDENITRAGAGPDGGHAHGGDENGDSSVPTGGTVELVIVDGGGEVIEVIEVTPGQEIQVGVGNTTSGR